MRVFSILVVALTSGALVSGAVAKDLDDMRLFFEPVKPEFKVDRPAQRLVPQVLSYHYNGFISSEAGRHYFINGVALADLARIKLVSVSDSGRTLELETVSGFVFKLAIGETRVVGE